MKKIVVFVLLDVVVIVVGLLLITMVKKSSYASVEMPPPEKANIVFVENADKSNDDGESDILNIKEFFTKHNEHETLNNMEMIKNEKILKSELKKKFPHVKSSFYEVDENRVLYVNQYTAEDYDNGRVRAEKIMVTEVWDAETETLISSSYKILENGEMRGMYNGEGN